MKKEIREIINRMTFVRELLQEFGVTLFGLDPGFTGYLMSDFNGSSSIDIGGQAFGWLEPILVELRDRRLTANATKKQSHIDRLDAERKRKLYIKSISRKLDKSINDQCKHAKKCRACKSKKRWRSCSKMLSMRHLVNALHDELCIVLDVKPILRRK